MHDPLDYYRDKRLLARFSGASELGEFTAYQKIEVTAEGRRRGYFDLMCGEYVNVPQSKLVQGCRVQLPVRDGMVCRILVGERAAAGSKKSDTQYDFLCLSFVHKQSIYVSELNDTLGLYDPNLPACRLFSAGKRTAQWYWTPGVQHNSNDFQLVVTSLQCTSPHEWIWKMPRPSLKGIGNPEDDFDGLPPSDGRTYTFDLKSDHGGGDFIKDYSRADFAAYPEDATFQLMEQAFTTYSVPKPNTALGQAKRAMTRKRQMRKAPASAPAKSARAVTSAHRVSTSSAKGKAACRASTAPAKAAARRAGSDDSEEEWRTDDEDEDDDADQDERGLVDDSLSTPPSSSPSQHEDSRSCSRSCLRSCSRSRSRSQSRSQSRSPSLPPSTPAGGGHAAALHSPSPVPSLSPTGLST